MTTVSAWLGSRLRSLNAHLCSIHRRTLKGLSIAGIAAFVEYGEDASVESITKDLERIKELDEVR